MNKIKQLNAGKRSMLAGLFLLLILFTGLSYCGRTYNTWAAGPIIISTPGQPVVTTSGSNPLIKWKRVEGATGYRLYRKTASDTSLVTVVTTTKTSYTDKKWTADKGQVVEYVVKAYVNTTEGKVWSSKSKAAYWLVPDAKAVKFSLSQVPGYSGDAVVTVNNNKPFFTTAEKKVKKPFENYTELDALGRCGTAFANISKELMPTEKRGSIGQVKPTGWQTVKYDKDIIVDLYLYNRCHLVAFELGAENANAKNLITGTRYMNVTGMLPYENMVADYIKNNTKNHVLYRVTPIFEGDNLVATGVLMEGYSVEDKGKGICFCVFAYNVQPQIEIDYATGDSWLAAEKQSDSGNKTESSKVSFILNTATKKIHYPHCRYVSSITEKNYAESSKSEAELIAEGYSVCKTCH